MTLDEYQTFTLETRQWDPQWNVFYTALGLAGEAGEVADQVKKMIRNEDAQVTPERKEKILDELGDTLYYLASLAYDLGVPLSVVATRNQKKLRDRLMKGQIKGR